MDRNSSWPLGIVSTLSRGWSILGRTWEGETQRSYRFVLPRPFGVFSIRDIALIKQGVLMPTLKINFAGIELKNPLIVASSELTDEFDKMRWAEDGGASAAIHKLAFLKIPFFARPYHIFEG